MTRFLIIFIPLYLFANLQGHLIDQRTKKPVMNAKVITDTNVSLSDAQGGFTLDDNSSDFKVKAYGYFPLKASLENNTTYLLEPIRVKALYLSFWAASPKKKTFKRVMNIIDTTEVNAIIVDVKNEFGLTSYKTDVVNVNKMGAYYQRTVKDMHAFMKIMKDKHIYTIARVVVFKDDLQATHFPKRALKTSDGNTWRNKEKLAWVNPFDEESHSNAINVAIDASKLGFDEINFDYIRFPAYRGIKYNKKCNQKTRIKAIESFLAKAQQRLDREGAFISVDTYGQICWADDDTGIGQTISSLAKHADYLSPMLYPSGFPKGAMGFADPTQHDYDIIYNSIEQMHDRIAPIRVRPWLQSFKDYAHSRKFYRAKEIRDQINASDDAQTDGWLIWNPSSRYHASAFLPKELEVKHKEEKQVVQATPRKAEVLHAKKTKKCQPLLKASPYGDYYFDHCQLHESSVFN